MSWPCLALALASCGAVDDMDAAEEQVAAFHRAYDAEQVRPAVGPLGADDAADHAEAQFLDLMDAVRPGSAR